MPTIGDVQSLVTRINREFDDWSNFFEHTKAVWRTFQAWVNDGHSLKAVNSATGQTFTEKDLIDLSQYYMTENLGPFALQRYLAIFEVFFFEFVRILLIRIPGSLGGTPLSLGELLAAGSIETVVAEAVDGRLQKLRYAKPKEWFEFLESVIKLGCPSADEVACIAEMKATRDIIEHNSGVVNKIYLQKAGSKSRFKEGDYIDVPDFYLRSCWTLLKKTCNDLGGVATKLLKSK